MQKCLLRLHWSTEDHGGPLLWLPCHAREADVPPDLVEGVLHLHAIALTPVLKHALLSGLPPFPWLLVLAEEPLRIFWISMSRHATLRVQHPWRIRFGVVDVVRRHPWGLEKPLPLPNGCSRAMQIRSDAPACNEQHR